jgi:hypothetical protein
MVLTISNHLTTFLDAPSSAGCGDGGRIVIRLPGHALTGAGPRP